MTRWCTSFRWRLVVVRVVFMVSFLPYPGRSDPQTNLLYQACSQVNATNLQSFFNNLNDTLIEIRKQLSNNNTYFATSDVSRYSQPVYVMAMCRKYMSTADCVSCFDFAASSIRSCGAFNGAQSVLDGCFLRYESSCFYDQITLPYNQGGICGNGTLSRQNLFEIAVDGLLSNLSIATPKINGFYAAAKAPVEYYPNTTAYAIAQCAITLTPDRCKRCLQVAYANIMICASEVIEARAVDDPGCFMRFSGAAFFLDYQTTNITPFLQNETSSNKGAIIGGVVGGVCSLIILLIVVFLWYDRLKRIPPGDNLYWAIELPRPKDYSYSDLKKATKDFSDECKLGEGGFGDVYKGIVDDKEVVAVKKLKVRNKRAKVGFENEILLVSNIRHRNLLRLLGCSSDGSNLLLVLEYMSNGSLDKFLWGEKRGALSWERRFDIIVGVARGLAHIHKEFHVSIVHRDIKSSNILLDDQFQPKIADFGLARFHPEDQSHVTTKFAGTLGYTAPEYVLYGRLSDKVDTFSFGIVILEIISSRKCTYRNFDELSNDCLLEYAWKLYENKQLVKLIDETLKVNEDEEKHVVKIIEIALICTQSPVSKRPTMSEVVFLLSNNDLSLEERQLTKPDFTVQSRRILIGCS